MRRLTALAVGLLGLGSVALAQRGGGGHGGFAAGARAVPGGSFRAYGGFGGNGLASRPFGSPLQRYPGMYGYRAPIPMNRYGSVGRSYGSLSRPYGSAWPARRPVYYPSAGRGPVQGPFHPGGYPRATTFESAFPYVQPLPLDAFLDLCFYDCPSEAADTTVAGEELSPWGDAGDPGLQTGQPPEEGLAYGAPSAPYPPGGTEPYTAPDAAPYPMPPGYVGGATGATQPMVLVPLVPAGRAPEPADEQETVTLIFKDGRPPLQVRNYLLTRSAIYLPGKHFNEIPLVDLDLPATQQVNWNAGVTFRLP